MARALALLGNKASKTADSSIEAPTKTSPQYMLPVLVLKKPMANGPTNPETLPMELINAIPDAAAYPVKKSQGSAQKGAKKLYAPPAISESATMDTRGEVDMPSSSQPRPPATTGIAA